MADPNVPINPPGGPTFTQRLWSEEVAIARAIDGESIDNRDLGYEFSNGRKFVTPVGVYVAPVPDFVAPAMTSAPVISGSAAVGATLSSTSGTWSGDPVPTITYQWKATGVAIPAATGSSYVVVAGDNGKAITCTVTATNVAGTANATSNSISIPAYTVPVNTVVPVISGTGSIGSTLTSTTGTWTGNPAPAYTYQWMLGISTIAGETNSTYVVLSNDQGEDITCVVTATNAAGSASESSNIISIPEANPDAVITALFANGEVGAWYDPSDLSTMFQDSAGTTPVTADGQPVGKILDKSGRGNHAFQSTAAARPLYKTDGTYHWLQFDGIDDYIGGAWTTPTSLSTVFYGTNRIDNESWVMFMRGVSASQGYAGVCQAGGTSAPQSSSGTPSYTVNQSIVTPTQRGALDTAIGFNALKVVTIENIDFNDAIFPWNAFGFGFYSGFAPQFRAYSVIALGRQATSQEITDTETWVNSKTGAY